jgi:hypothetical protein
MTRKKTGDEGSEDTDVRQGRHSLSAIGRLIWAHRFGHTDLGLPLTSNVGWCEQVNQSVVAVHGLTHLVGNVHSGQPCSPVRDQLTLGLSPFSVGVRLLRGRATNSGLRGHVEKARVPSLRLSNPKSGPE